MSFGNSSRLGSVPQKGCLPRYPHLESLCRYSYHLHVRSPRNRVSPTPKDTALAKTERKAARKDSGRDGSDASLSQDHHQKLGDTERTLIGNFQEDPTVTTFRAHTSGLQNGEVLSSQHVLVGGRSSRPRKLILHCVSESRPFPKGWRSTLTIFGHQISYQESGKGFHHPQILSTNQQFDS